MAESELEIDRSSIESLIASWIKKRLDNDAFSWITTTSEELRSGAEDWEFFASFSGVPQKTGKAAANLSSEEVKQAQDLRPGWQPGHWTLDQLGRTYLVLAIAERKDFLDLLEKTFISSDTGEAVALYQSLPLLPYPEQLAKRA
ncbi:MAG TPA: hypothetical protein VK074_09515, partial [Fodinibius sp.]|nr:hypothetical protein [Fodinibius sp.]